MRNGKMAQCLRAWTVLAEDPSAVPSTHFGQPLVTPAPADPRHPAFSCTCILSLTQTGTEHIKQQQNHHTWEDILPSETCLCEEIIDQLPVVASGCSYTVSVVVAQAQLCQTACCALAKAASREVESKHAHGNDVLINWRGVGLGVVCCPSDRFSV